jgi:serine/threonine protein kinase
MNLATILGQTNESCVKTPNGQGCAVLRAGAARFRAGGIFCIEGIKKKRQTVFLLTPQKGSGMSSKASEFRSDFRKVCPQCEKTFLDEDALEILTECPDDGATLIFDAVDPIVGTLLADRFQVEALIGRGATSTVYRAREVSGNGNSDSTPAVAVKVLHPHLSGDAAVVKRLSQEAKSLRDFSHKNVVNMISLGVTKQGQPFLVMELVEGKSLLDYMRQNGALKSERCFSLFEQILDAVGVAHSKGILHRDLKPGNIMLSENGSDENFCVKLLDFGIAKIVPLQGDTFFRLTQTGEMMGSLLYMSPEQCLEQDWDQRGDIYSLGCVFYESLTARAPLIGRTAFETMNMHLSEMPPPLSAVRPDLSFAPGIETVVMKMLAKDPSQRYQTADEVRRDLKLVMEGKGASLEEKASSKKQNFIISKLKGESSSSTPASKIAGAERDALASKRSRQRMLEIAIFIVLMLIWGIPLVFAFAYMPNALISACLFGVLLPFLAAVSAMVVVRVGQITGVGTVSLLSMVGSRSGGGNLLYRFAETGSLLLGTETGMVSNILGGGSARVIEPFQRTQALPILFLGKEATGKTRLLASLATNDVDDARRSQFVLSPDGELANLVVRWIAAHPQAKAMSKRVILIDLEQELSQVGIAEGYGISGVIEVSDRIVEAMNKSETDEEKAALTEEQTKILRASLILLLAANESASNLPDFLTKEQKRSEILKKLPLWNGKGKDKGVLEAMRKIVEETPAEKWDELVQPLLSICFRFPLNFHVAALRIFFQHSSVISDVISKRKVMIVKGSSLRDCSLFFRLVFNEILKERRPSALLSDAETYPVVYVDDVEECGVSDCFVSAVGNPTETGIEFLLSAKSLNILSTEEVIALFSTCGLGAFCLSDSDATAVAGAFGFCFPGTGTTVLTDVDKDKAGLTERARAMGRFSKSTILTLPQQNYFYMPKSPDARPVHLLTPSFSEVRITEVEWAIVEAMRTGWMFNL